MDKKNFLFLKVIGKSDADILQKMGYKLIQKDGETYTFENNNTLMFASDDVKNRIVFSSVLNF